MKSLALLSLLSLVACTTLPEKEIDTSRFQGIGIVEIERADKNDRGAALGSFAYPVRMNDSDFLVGTLGGSFGRFHTPSGSYRWRKTYRVGVASRPAIRGNRVYIGAMDGFIYAYDIGTGKEIWKKKLSSESTANLVMGEDYLYVATADNVLWALNVQTGDEQWTLRRPSPNAAYYWSLRGSTSGVLSPDKKTLYLGFSDGVVVALKAATGEVVWERSYTRPGRFQDADTEPVLSPDGNSLYVALPDHSIQVLRTTDGSSTDSYGDAAGFVPLLNFKEGTLTYTTPNGSVRKYLLSTKKLLWELDLKKRGVGVEFHELSSGEILMTSTHFGLHLLDGKTGKILGEHYLGEGVLSRPVSDGSRVFVMTGRGRLAFLKIKKKS